MALTHNASSGAPKAVEPSGAPRFTAALFFAGVVLVFLGERVLLTLTNFRVVTTSVGVLAMAVATGLRWTLGARARGDRGRIERLLGVAQVGACLAVALALLSNLAPGRLGLDGMDAERREFWENTILVGWVLLLLFSLLPLGFAEAALGPMRKARHPESRRVVAAASAGLTVALALGYLGLFVGAAHRYGVAADYAYFKTAKPSESTLAVARNLKEPVRIVAFFPALNEVRNEVDRYLRDVSRNNAKVRVEFVDRVLEPKVAREMRVSQDGTLVLSRGEVRQMMNVGLELKNARSTLRNFDQEFQKNLMKLARDARTAYLTVGHRELNDSQAEDTGAKRDKTRGVTALRKLLEMQNYRVLDLGLPQGLGQDVPSDAGLVVILGPKDPFAPEEVAALKRYVERGGALLMGLDAEAVADASEIGKAPAAEAGSAAPVPSAAPSSAPDTTAMARALGQGGLAPNLNELAKLAGLAVEPYRLANDRGDSVGYAGNKSDRGRIVTNRFSSHASVSTLNRNSLWVVLFGTGSLTKLDANDKGIDFALRSTANTFADINGNFEFDGPEQRKTYEIAAAVTRKQKTEQRSFVIADADLFSDTVLKNVPHNRVLLVDAVRWLGNEESLAGELSSEEDVRIEHTKDKDVFWFYLTILGVPALILGAGLYVSRQARKKGENR
ncbi:MAG: Gldg family protein [Polyangiaceae bacterium]